MQKRETVGKIATSLMQKQDIPISPIEIEREAHKDYGKNLLQCFDEARKIYPDNFFLVVITKKEPLLENVLRNYFFHRSTCPTPDYDQAVYRYVKKDDAIEFLWVIPSKDACLYLKKNAKLVIPDEHSLLNYVLRFADGTLYAWAKRLNDEEKDSNLLQTR